MGEEGGEGRCFVLRVTYRHAAADLRTRIRSNARKINPAARRTAGSFRSGISASSAAAAASRPPSASSRAVSLGSEHVSAHSCSRDRP